jgi:hypothetical protein
MYVCMYVYARLCMSVQGIGFGGVDTLCNIVLPELWKGRVQVCMCVCVYMCINVYVCICHVCVMYMCVWRGVYACIYVCMYMCIYKCLYVYVYIYVRMYIL